ncbi:hypothetical protein VNI00_008152 [Paramarasmius palmivorus]|uniref:Uncharacterized protein n=1 Tax=Paramarasmius palmivorus TaxID=297713 RepID=A0AAW0D111_9AGAR
MLELVSPCMLLRSTLDVSSHHYEKGRRDCNLDRPVKRLCWLRLDIAKRSSKPVRLLDMGRNEGATRYPPSLEARGTFCTNPMNCAPVFALRLQVEVTPHTSERYLRASSGFRETSRDGISIQSGDTRHGELWKSEVRKQNNVPK